ncbi:MAG: apolipoprotein N-acyltransferase [Spirochaetaceae bacterium]|jgi:apolipoprotein N-acyltransferase|nr:apolipoprotein N-acyltransferase [Spirochaetaceae bacterium]
MAEYQGPAGRRRPVVFLLHLGALIAAALLFAASFPNPLFSNGLPLLAWIAYVPVFYLVNTCSWKSSVVWGALYGYSAYGLFNYWLTTFHPLAGTFVGLIYLLYFAVLFPLLKAASYCFRRRGYLVQWALWISYEYLRTLGFLGYPYGISGYSQWQLWPVTQIASLFGVWGVSALVVFPSAACAWILRGLDSQPARQKQAASRQKQAASRREGRPSRQEQAALPPAQDLKRALKNSAIRFIFRERYMLGAWVFALVFTLVFGLIRGSDDYAGRPYARLALIQHNDDPWRGGIAANRKNLEVLKRLSLEALAEDPRPDLVVWSETAFVPRIFWHATYREDQESYRLVRELLDFLETQDVPFVIGNDDGRKDPVKNPDPSKDHRIDYNAAILFDRGKEIEKYRKLHLVPFTESFPYKKQFPRIYAALEKADTHLWEPGDTPTVFNSRGIKFSTPICFEDSFGYLSREFVRQGAELIVNLTNDAWSKSLSAQMQHLSMAVFRAVENRRSMVRSTASGQTCAIDPSGKILAMAPPFSEARLTVSVPLMDEETLYTRRGDYVPLLAIGFSLLSFTWALIRIAINRKKV